jgi:CspA family cold shock protein
MDRAAKGVGAARLSIAAPPPDSRPLRRAARLPISVGLQSHIDGLRRFAAPSSFIPCSCQREAPPASGAAANMKEYPMSITGTVKFFNSDKGYGFIAPDQGGNDAFVHITAVERAGMVTLQQNQRLSYELEQDRRGKTSAVNLAAAD